MPRRPGRAIAQPIECGTVREQLQRLADDHVATYPQMPGLLLRVLGSGVDVEVAAGVADRESGEPLTPGRRFRIASVTKTFVAATALRLHEDGELDLDQPISSLVLDETVALLRIGGYRPDAITTRQLLTHTSGVYDFAGDAYGPPTDDGYVAACLADPGRRWTRLEQLRFAVEHGKPYGEPGEVFCYSDTGANLVGEIIERLTGQTMGAAIRERVEFERLGLLSTYHESVEPEPVDLSPIAHQYEGDFDVWRYDPSVDLWGGGGLVSTCADLARFFRALLRNEVFREPTTLATMCTLPDRPAAGPANASEAASTGMFLARHESASHVFWGHAGYWGTSVATCPELDLTVVAQDGQAHMPAGYRKTAIVDEVLALL
jgi:D-alanyl-D-alanine carboxypeptidase